MAKYLVRDSAGVLEPLLFQQVRGCDPLGGLHDQHLLDAMLGIIRDLVPVGPGKGVLPLSDPPQDGVFCGAPERGVAHKQNVHDDTCAPDVAAALVA